MTADGLRALIVLGLAVLAIAITVWVIRPAFQGPQRARQLLGTHRLALGSIVAVLLGSVLVALPFRGLVDDSGRFDAVWQIIAASIATQLPMVALVYGRVIAPGALGWRDLGLRPLPPGRVLGVGLLGALGGLVIVFVLGLALSHFGVESNQLEEFDVVRHAAPIEFGVALAEIAVVTPVVEELFFRGYLFGLYRRRKSLWMAFLASSLLFAGLHANPILSSPTQMLAVVSEALALGTLLAFLYLRTGSLYPGMVAHALNNGLVVTLLYLGAS
jgi:membrane protease YdiL (CAAX protease family)